MAQKANIDHIEYGGVTYEFEDSTARKLANEAAKKVSDHDDLFYNMIENETKRAERAESAIRDDMASIAGLNALAKRVDGVESSVNNPKAFVGATSTLPGEKGAVPQPQIDDREKFLKADGKWAVPHDTTYSVVTQSVDGLMSSDDKLKLDSMDTENDELMSGRTVFGDGVITETLAGKTKTTTFNSDGSITLVIHKTGVPDDITVTTVFNADGSITRTRS